MTIKYVKSHRRAFQAECGECGEIDKKASVAETQGEGRIKGGEAEEKRGRLRLSSVYLIIHEVEIHWNIFEEIWCI